MTEWSYSIPRNRVNWQLERSDFASNGRHGWHIDTGSDQCHSGQHGKLGQHRVGRCNERPNRSVDRFDDYLGAGQQHGRAAVRRFDTVDHKHNPKSAAQRDTGNE